MKPTNLKLVLVFLGILGCVKDNDFSTPEVQCTEPNLQATTTLQQVKEMYIFGAPTVIDSEVMIEGYVVSSDKAGNLYKTLSIQDQPENPTAGIKIAIDQTQLYNKYNVGRKIFINLKGLAIGNSFGSLQIGKARETELDRIPALEVNKHVFRSCEVAEIIPKKVRISELDESLLNLLIEIENVQFRAYDLDKSYGNVENSETVDRELEAFNNDCMTDNSVILRNSGFSQFKNQVLPQGKGTVKGILGNYYDDLQLYIRDPEDLNLTESRCENSSEIEANISLKAIRDQYEGSMIEFGIYQNYIVEGYVISSDQAGNFKNRLVIQDKFEKPEAGIQVLIEEASIFEHFSPGDKVFIKLNKLYMSEQEGVLSIGYPKGDRIIPIPAENRDQFIVNNFENFEVLPQEISIQDSQNPLFESTLVKISNVQLIAEELGSAFTYFSGTSNGMRILESCGETTRLNVFTHGEAIFANKLFPQGRGAITGVLSENLELRSEVDVQFNEPFEACLVIIPKIMITEIADPKNNVSARFVELYNAGDSEINLTGWHLNKYINGSKTVSNSGVDLSRISIPSGGFVIIANSDYPGVFNDSADILSTYISGNGDDVYEITDHTGKTIDIFGRIGEDGNGTDWEYLDGRAVRNSDISQPNPVFNPMEWHIYTAASNELISHPNSAQNAPGDFDPRVR